MKSLYLIAVAALLFSGSLVWSQDEVVEEVRDIETVLIDDLSPEVKARAEAEAQKREAEEAQQLGVPESLDAALAAALANNPDILLAAAKVRQAEAELNQVRLKTVQDVLVAYKQYDIHMRHSRRVDIAVNREEAAKAQQDLVESEALVRYLLGVPPSGLAESPREPAPAATISSGAERVASEARARPELPRELADALSAEVDCQFVEMPLRDIMEMLQGEIGMVVTYGSDLHADEIGAEEGRGGFSSGRTVISLNLGRTSWKNVLTALNDKFYLAFVVRDYGLLVTRANNAVRTPGAAIPETLPYRPE